ncbi:MAG: efflux RND transporter periplasmic adaptor subunit [Betaproteobacteria bacterium]|nr:MAG: efflux RND transporter periplasmic adaptor subunit [Betaproteobacteria bacterium]
MTKLRIARASLLIIAALAAGSALGAGPAGSSVSVEVATARTARVAPHAWIPGSIVSRDDARIAGIVAGRVVWIAEVGQRCGAGATLARLDDTVVKLRVADLQAQVARAQSQADLARTQLDRYQSLAATKIYPASQLDEASAQLEMAKHDVARLTAQLRQAEYETQQSEVRAPFSGVVTERFAQRGEYLQIGAAVVRLVNTDDVEARATAALAFAGNVKPGQIAALRVGNDERRGKVRAIVPVGDDRSRQFEIRVALTRVSWPVGTAVEVSVPTGADRTAVVVPRDAIVIRQSHSYVMRVAQNGTVERREVESGSAIEDLVEIRNGVSAGDRLVVRGAERLEPGQAIIITDPRPAADRTPLKGEQG